MEQLAQLAAAIAPDFPDASAGRLASLIQGEAIEQGIPCPDDQVDAIVANILGHGLPTQMTPQMMQTVRRQNGAR